MMITRRLLGAAARDYIRERLDDGRALSSLVLALVDLQHGACWTYLPATVAEEAVTRFDASVMGPGLQFWDPANAVWVAPVDTRLREPVIDDIQAYLAQGPERAFVFEHQLAAPGDPGLQGLTIPHFFYNDEVYLCLYGGVQERSTIAAAFMETGSFNAIGFLISHTETALPPASGTSVPRDALVRLARGVTALFVEAFDGEGCVLWSAQGELLTASKQASTRPGDRIVSPGVRGGAPPALPPAPKEDAP